MKRYEQILFYSADEVLIEQIEIHSRRFSKWDYPKIVFQYLWTEFGKSGRDDKNLDWQTRISIFDEWAWQNV